MGRTGVGSESGVERIARPDSLRELIYRDLRARLQRGAVGPDDRLVDLDIAAAYGTSRMPAREALLQLVNEGYLVRTTRGFMLPRLTAQDIRDLFEVRRLLEPKAASNAARDFRKVSRPALDAALAAARAAHAAQDPGAFASANMAFRAAWLGEVRNRRLAETIARFVDHAQIVRLGTLGNPETRDIVLAGLVGLHDAFLRGDAAAATERMAAFMDAAEASYFRGAELSARALPRRRAAAG